MKALTILSLCLFASFASANEIVVNAMRAPDEGLQPLAQVDSQGTLHLIYFKGDPAHGNLFHVGKNQGETSFTPPVKVNQIENSVIAIGTIRGAQFVLGQKGLLHVAWMGSKASKKKEEDPTPMLYTRSLDGGKTFETERNVIESAYGLDGGGSVAADANGNVLVAWHAGPHEGGEAGRRIWTRMSNNDGKSFEPETAVDNGKTGVCGCCGMLAYASERGGWQILYRSATDQLNRDMYLLAPKGGKAFTSRQMDAWKIEACPMSSAALVAGIKSSFGAWESEMNIIWASLDGTSKPLRLPVETKPLKRKHPAMALDSEGRLLLSWTEGTGWNRGGRLHWQVFDRDGKASGKEGVKKDLPAWSKPSAVSLPGGGFLITY